jgi:hypothetical protein
MAAVVVLGLLGLVAPQLTALELGACAAAVVVAVAALDHYPVAREGDVRHTDQAALPPG